MDAASILMGGHKVTTMKNGSQVLLTLPNASSWTVPHNIWHLDLPRLPLMEVVGIQMFTFLHRVKPGGGGTLIVAGSHLLLNNGKFIRSKQVKKQLRHQAYFRDLMSKDLPDRQAFMTKTGKAGNVELQVEELYGEPGDVYLVDMSTLHTVAPNADPVPRIMLAHRLVRQDSLEEIYGVYAAKVRDHNGIAASPV